MHGPDHRQVLQRHLGRAVGANLDAGVRAAKAKIGARDGTHADEVIGAGEKCRKGGGEGFISPDAESRCGGDELLLGDVHLEEPVGECLGEFVGVGRIADLTVQGNNGGIVRTECCQSVAVSLSRSDLLALFVAGKGCAGSVDPCF